jgi:hypothetical protein
MVSTHVTVTRHVPNHMFRVFPRQRRHSIRSLPVRACMLHELIRCPFLSVREILVSAGQKDSLSQTFWLQFSLSFSVDIADRTGCGHG